MTHGKRRLALALAFAHIVFSSEALENGSFKEAGNEALLAHWDVSTRGTTAVRLIGSQGEDDFHVRISSVEPGGLAIVSQSFDAAPYLGRPIKLELRYRSSKFSRIIGGLILTSLDDGGQTLGSVKTGDYLEGSKAWTDASLRTVVDARASTLRLQIISWFKSSDTEETSGTVWLDDISIQSLQSGETSTEARSYLLSALDLIEQHALAGDGRNWDELRRNALALTYDATKPTDTYAAIRYVLGTLNDGHSRLIGPPRPEKDTQPEQDSTVDTPTLKMVSGRIGVLTIPSHPYLSADLAQSYVATAHQAISDGIAANACAWVVDLRANHGGDDTPMIASVAPLLGDGEVGSFSIRNGESGPTIVKAGELLRSDGTPAVPVTEPIGSLGLPPVAVLIGPGTVSAAESTAIRFGARPSTRFFGQPSAGKVSGNISIPLSDGAILALAAGYASDRSGKKYTKAIEPDEYVEASNSDDTDRVLAAAVSWLQSQPACP